MRFLLENTEFPYVKLDCIVAKKTMDESKGNEYKFIRIDELCDLDITYKEYIPIGSIDFVQEFYKKYYGIKRENSLEIPKCLRVQRFLNRRYMICEYANLPEKGKYFIKDATDEKTFSFIGDIKKAKKEIESINVDIKSHRFVCSEIIRNIYSEFRFYVVRGEIKQISCYKGNPMAMFNYEIVSEITKILSSLKEFPKSFSFDVIISKEGTSLLEVHTYCALGIHNYMWDCSLLTAYKDCHDYYVNYNKPIELD